MNPQHIIFSHGLDGAQWGVKITAMAEVARRYRLHVDSIDYRCTLHVIDGDHRVQCVVDQVCDLFGRFLRRLGVPPL